MNLQHMLLYEILHRLPTKTLMRFKCINKFFQTYISSKDFINLHLRHSISSGTNHLVIFLAAPEGDNSNTDHLYSLDLDSVHSPEPRAHHCLDLPKLISGKSDLYVVGCCNGLICFRSCRRHDDYYWLDKKNNNSKIALNLMIFNPCTGMFKSNILLTFSDLCYRTNMICTSVGFGYDSVNDDYKIVVVDYYNDERQLFDLDYHHLPFNYENLVIHRKTLVYSLKADSWRCVDETSATLMRHPDYFYALCNNGALVNNHLVHWLYCYPANKGTSIGVFNLETEKWVDDELPLPIISLPFPYHVDDLDCKKFYVGVLDGCLCFTLNFKGKHEIWMMKEYGVHESWMKFVSIPISRCSVVFPNGCGTRGEILLRKNLQSTERLFVPCDEFDGHTLDVKSSVWYDIEDKTMERFLTFTGAPLRHKVLALTLGSLVPVCGGRQAIKNQDR